MFFSRPYVFRPHGFLMTLRLYNVIMHFLRLYVVHFEGWWRLQNASSERWIKNSTDVSALRLCA